MDKKNIIKEFIEDNLGYISGDVPEYSTDNSLDTPFAQTDKIKSMTRQPSNPLNSWGMGYVVTEDSDSSIGDDDDSKESNGEKKAIPFKDDKEVIDLTKKNVKKASVPKIFDIKNRMIVSSFHTLVKELNSSKDENDKLAVLYALLDSVKMDNVDTEILLDKIKCEDE